jgi:uncharacterized protein YdeI (YjbR/CyaY-like superfamily)
MRHFCVSMKIQRSFANRATWRAWLERNHARVEEVWLVYYKKATGKSSIDYAASVEEALCFGWIDGLKKRVDARRYMHRFTPRRRGSRWSAINIARVKRLRAAGRMTQAGLAAFEPENTYDHQAVPSARTNPIELPPEMEQALRKSRSAWRNFTALAPSYRRSYVLWLTNAKRPETKRKRLAEALERLERNEKHGMK